MRLPVNVQMCPTCPFRDDGWTEVRDLLVRRTLTEGSPICHSTGKGALVRKRGQGKARLCRGARDVALQYFAAIGVLMAPTDAAWEAKCQGSVIA